MLRTLFTLVPRQRVRLLVMRASDMAGAHPATDWSHHCDKCHQQVAVPPSARKILQHRKRVEIICTHCTGGIDINAMRLGRSAPVEAAPSIN